MPLGFGDIWPRSVCREVATAEQAVQQDGQDAGALLSSVDPTMEAQRLTRTGFEQVATGMAHATCKLNPDPVPEAPSEEACKAGAPAWEAFLGTVDGLGFALLIILFGLENKSS